MNIKSYLGWQMTWLLPFGCVPGVSATGDGEATQEAARNDPDPSSARATAEGTIPIQRCPNANPEKSLERPSLCEWANSLDMLLLGAVVERAVVSSPYAVETHAVEGMQQAVESLGVAEEFPWLEAVTAKGQMDSEFHVVSSCPDGLREENSDWRVHATVIPSMAISLKSDVVFLGDAKMNPVITFYVGWEQRQYWTGPKLSEMGAWQGSQLAPGSYIGVGLTYDAAMKLILGTHAPFGVDVERRLHAPVAECMPRLTEELDGVSIEDLRAKLATCVDDEEAVAKGKLLRAERLRLVSVPLHSPATSAFCSVGFESKSAQ